jgi:uncharacterized membrane protein (UPF0127 family)
LLIALALAAALLPLASASGCSGSQRKSDEPEGWVEIRGQRIEVEVAEDPATQAKGLGDRDSLAWDRGMLFVYEEPAFYAFWMKGMRFSIDIVWLRKGRIVDLDVNVPFEPGGNGPTLRPSSLTDAVLEVPAGYAMAHGWRIGDRVDFERGTPP